MALFSSIKRWSIPLGVTTLGGLSALSCWLAGAQTGAQALAILTGLFLLCEISIRAASVLVRFGHPLFGMAGALLDEAVHRHLVRWTAGIVCVFLVALAFGSNTNERLDYALRFFIEWSQLIVEVALSILSLVVAARSVSSEYIGKQIQTNLTKPVSRLNYLLGKWLGLMLINAVLLMVFGMGVVLFTGVIENRWTHESKLSENAKAVEVQAAHRSVLTARFQTTPAMENPQALTGYFYERLEGMAASGGLEANQAVQEELKKIKETGRYPAPETFKALLTKSEYGNAMELATGKWYSLGTDGDGQSSIEPAQIYVFSHLGELLENTKTMHAKIEARLVSWGLTEQEAHAYLLLLLGQTSGMPTSSKTWFATRFEEHKSDIEAMKVQLEAQRLQLTLKPNAGGATPRTGMVELRVEVNGKPLFPLQAEERKSLVKAGIALEQMAAGHRLLPTDQLSSLEIPMERIDDAGQLKVRLTRVLVNKQFPQPTILFDTKGGINLYGAAGLFSINLAAAFILMLVKLSFLVMLGLVAGALFDFPVACLIAIAVYAFVAYAGGLQASFEDYLTLGRKPTEGIDYYLMQLKTGVRVSMLNLLKVTPDFEAYNGRALLVDGIIVPWSVLLECVGVLGFLWTGGLTLVGWFLFLRREIARVIV